MTNKIKNGTVLICNTGGSQFKIGQVVDTVNTQWGTHYDILVTLKSDEGAVNIFDRIGNISNADMKGIGWKLATHTEIELANEYAKC